MLFAIIGSIIVGAILGTYIAYREEKKEAIRRAETDPLLLIAGIPNAINDNMTYTGWLKKRLGII